MKRSTPNSTRALLDKKIVTQRNGRYYVVNMKSLLLVSKSIRAAALGREDSRGAHFRADFPDVRDLENSRYTCVTWKDGRFEISTRPVQFTRVKPGETLLEEPVAA